MISVSRNAWNVLAVIAILCIVGIAAAHLVAPDPKNTLTDRQKSRDLGQLRSQIKIQAKQLASQKAAVNRYVWNENMDRITSKSLDAATALATANKVQLLGFRPPQKTTEQDGLTHIQYLILLSGPFSGVESFVESLEDAKYKLAVETVQFSSADASSDQVSASIGVIAYKIPPQEQPSGKKGK